MEADTLETGDPLRILSLPSTCAHEYTTLIFSYSMYGADMGTLNVYSKSVLYTLEWTASGDKGEGWSTATVPLSKGTTGIMFEAIRGVGYRSDIAIDEISK